MPVAALEVLSPDALGRILGMQIKWSPFDSRAEPALKPRDPLEADVAERSYVVAPDRDHGRAIGCLVHP
jgi:hypothetical protein